MKMSKCPHCKKEIQFLADKKTALVYSLYLVIGALSFFIAMNLLYTAYQGYIWSYTTKYVVNTIGAALLLCIASGLLFMGCYQLLKGRRYPILIGGIGCGLLLIYPVYIVLIDSYISFTSYYILLLWIPALIVLLVALFIYRRQQTKKK
jgi:hypothetical protein